MAINVCVHHAHPSSRGRHISFREGLRRNPHLHVNRIAARRGSY
jgi:hypothetical protein